MTQPGKEPEAQGLRTRPIAEVAGVLQEVLGQRMTAFAIAEHNPRQIGAFAHAAAVPSDEQEVTLRDLAEVTERQLAINHGSSETVRAVMLGANPILDHRHPIELFHEGKSATVIRNAGNL